MADHETEAAFHEMMIHEAARDGRLRVEFLRQVMQGYRDESVGPGDVARAVDEAIAAYYGNLDSIDMQRVAKLIQEAEK